MDRDAVDRNVDRGRETWLARVIRVSIHGAHRRNEPELQKDLISADIACVQNELHA
jgi:hypothetical protein